MYAPLRLFAKVALSASSDDVTFQHGRDPVKDRLIVVKNMHTMATQSILPLHAEVYLSHEVLLARCLHGARCFSSRER